MTLTYWLLLILIAGLIGFLAAFLPQYLKIACIDYGKVSGNGNLKPLMDTGMWGEFPTYAILKKCRGKTIGFLRTSIFKSHLAK